MRDASQRSGYAELEHHADGGEFEHRAIDQSISGDEHGGLVKRYTSADKAQYPLTMTDYAMVPTCGLTTVH